jgi:hypothetical protein
MSLQFVKVLVVGLLISACSSSVSTVTSTVEVLPSTTMATTSTSTNPPSTTETLPRSPEVPSSTPIPENKIPRAKLSTEKCDSPGGSHYCIWGTEPLDLVVNNSSITGVQQNVVQSFVAVSDQISMVVLPLQTSDIGELVLLSQLQTPSASCLSVHLLGESGRRIASSYFGDGGGVGRLQLVEVPLVASVQVGGRYKLEVLKEPACVSRSVAIRIATSSLWMYPKASGKLFLDSQTSNGSLWARIN